MNSAIRSGPYRIVLLHCGKFDHAEVDLDVPVHLIGPNNVGKTSLIALLQFLYLDDQRQMHFSRDMNETRAYYFPEKYSYALFECLTPGGFQTVGVHGLGPVRRFEFERFTYNGRIDMTDYLDADNRVREPEDIFARLAVKEFKRLEPRQLRAALTGTGDSHGAYLALIPARHTDTYIRFRKVFGNLLRLSHIRQDELKQLILDIYRNDFQQTEIDLARNYADNFKQVQRDSKEVQDLKILQADIELLLHHLELREQARRKIPAMWQAVGAMFNCRKKELDNQEQEWQEKQRRLKTEIEGLATQIENHHAERRSLAKSQSNLEQCLETLAKEREKMAAFVPEWARSRLQEVKSRRDELAIKLNNALLEPPARVEKKLKNTEQSLRGKQELLNHLQAAVVTLLRKNFSDTDITDAFRLLNPDLLSLPVNSEKPGFQLSDQQAALAELREILKRRRERRLYLKGSELDLEAISAPDLAAYHDAKLIQDDIAALEQEIKRCREAIDTAREEAKIKEEKENLEKEAEKLIGDLNAYDKFCRDTEKEPEWRQELNNLEQQDRKLQKSIDQAKSKNDELNEASQEAKNQLNDIIRQRQELRETVQSLPRPADESWPLMERDDLPQDWESLVAAYRRTCAEEKNQAQQVEEHLETIDKRTYSRYTGDTENETVQALRNQLASIPERERAVEELWKSIAVGIKKDLGNITKDLDTLKSLISNLNRKLAAVSISNLSSLRLQVEEWPRKVNPIRSAAFNEEMPLFSNPGESEKALTEISRLLSENPRIELRELFNLTFEVGTPDGKSYRHQNLDAIESNGTTIAIKVLVNLVLLRGLLGSADVQIPFYLDECSSLDQDNLSALVKSAQDMGFIAVLASPDAMDVAEKLYFINEQENGRVVLDPQSALVRVKQRLRNNEEELINA